MTAITVDAALGLLDEAVSDLHLNVIRVKRNDGTTELLVPQKFILAVQFACADLLTAGAKPPTEQQVAA
jgi:hypothetical protein